MNVRYSGVVREEGIAFLYRVLDCWPGTEMIVVWRPPYGRKSESFRPKFPLRAEPCLQRKDLRQAVTLRRNLVRALLHPGGKP